MRKNVLELVGALALIFGAGAGIVLLYMWQSATPPVPQANVAKLNPKEEKAKAISEWPTGTRFAVVSADGSTVAAMINREIVIFRKGSELYRLAHFQMLQPQMRINADGSRLAVYWLAKRGVSLWDINERKEVSFNPLALNSSYSFQFSKDGTKLVLNNGNVEMSVPTGAKPASTLLSAIVSDDGRTIVVTGKHTHMVVREGRQLCQVHGLSNPVLNRDGNRLMGFDAERKSVVLMDASNAQELKAYAASPEVSYKFSPGGSLLGILEPGATEMTLWFTSAGNKHVTLPATYSFSIDGRVHTIRYTAGTFYFEGVEPSDSKMTVTMFSLTEEKEGKQVQHRSRIQWEAEEYGSSWRNVNLRVFGPLDQTYDFDSEGNLRSHVKM